MTTSVLKKKLTKAIDNIEDADFLKALHTIVSSKTEETAFGLSATQKKELDRRMADHKAGRSKSYSWDEVKKSLLSRKK